MLLDEGADFHLPLGDDNNFRAGTPLHTASWLGDVETVKLLLERGADTEAEAFGETPLFWATGYEARFLSVGPRKHDAKWKVVKLLLDSGANPCNSRKAARFNSISNTRQWTTARDWEVTPEESRVVSSAFLGRHNTWPNDKLHKAIQHVRALKPCSSPPVCLNEGRGRG